MSKDRLFSPELISTLPVWGICSGGRAMETRASLTDVLISLNIPNPVISVLDPRNVEDYRLSDFFSTYHIPSIQRGAFMAAYRLMYDPDLRLGEEYNEFGYTDYSPERFIRNSISGVAAAKIMRSMFAFLTDRQYLGTGNEAVIVARDTVNFVRRADSRGILNWFPQNKPKDDIDWEKQRDEILNTDYGILITGFALGAELRPIKPEHLIIGFPELERTVKFGGFPFKLGFYIDTVVQTAFFRFKKDAAKKIDSQALTMSRPGGIKFEDPSVRTQMEWYVANGTALHTLENTHKIEPIDRHLRGGNWLPFYDLNYDTQTQITNLQQGQITYDQLSGLILSALGYLDQEKRFAKLNTNLGNGREFLFFAEQTRLQGIPVLPILTM